MFNQSVIYSIARWAFNYGLIVFVPFFLKPGQTIVTFERNKHVTRVWPSCWVLRIGRNTVARTWPNDYNIMQHPIMLYKKFDHFQIGQHTTCRNTSQHVATRWQTAYATCCSQQCCKFRCRVSRRSPAWPGIKDVRANFLCASLLCTQIHMPRHASRARAKY